MLRLLGKDDSKLQYLLRQVKSGDIGNVEGRAAVYYWEQFFENRVSFTRNRDGGYPNAFLNYGYAVLLAIMARALVGSGLLPAFGIHHRNKYNPWCLASDIMEPYRPLVDQVILNIMEEFPEDEKLRPEIKKSILQIPAIDVVIDDKRSPLLVAAQRTTASLAACFEGSSRRILYPLI